MSFLLDTNVVSEWVKPRPNPGVVAWLAQVDEDRTYLSVVTLAELRHGIERLNVGVRRRRLDQWLREELIERFEGRVLAVDSAVADAWGRIVAAGEAAGRSVGAMDGLIAATAQHHGLTVVTRNTADFTPLGCRTIDPWTA